MDAKKQGPLDVVITQAFPILLQLVEHCVGSPSVEAGEAVRIIGKIVHSCIAVRRPRAARTG